MSQNSIVTPNPSGPGAFGVFRAALNNALHTLLTRNSGTGEPPVTHAYMEKVDETSGYIYHRNSANDAWDPVRPIDFRPVGATYANDTYAVTLTPAVNGYKDGCLYMFNAADANTGQATSINISAIVARPLVKLLS